MSDTETMLEFEFSINLANAEAPVPLPQGNYPFEVRQAGIKKSAKGNDLLVLALYIAPESYPVDFTDGHPDGTTLLYQRLVLRDDVPSRFQTRKLLEALGAKLSNKLNPNDLMGLTGTVEVTNSIWEGMPRAEANKIIAK